MAQTKYDLVVIGSGPGGYVAAIRAAQLGMKTACIEKEATLGGTCLNVGCIPSKALLHSTQAYHWILHQSNLHGIEASSTKIDFSQMMRRKEEVVNSLVGSIPALFKRHQIDSIRGLARLESPQVIEVTDGKEKKRIETDKILLATGSEPTSLPFLPFDEKKVLSSTGALSLKAIPKKMVVIGGGAIGVELASVYNRLGTEVIVVELLDTLCSTVEESLSKLLLPSLKKQGIQFYLEAKVEESIPKKNGISLCVTLIKEQKTIDIESDVVLVAIGRRPYIQGLGLEEIGIKRDSRGSVAVDGGFRTSIPNIYAIGDLIDGPMLAHKASEEGIAAVELMKGMAAHVNYMTIPNIIYTHPEIASVGLTEKEASQMGVKTIVGVCSFKGNPRARCMGETEGTVKVIAEKESKRLIGVHIMGVEASEMIGEGVIAIEAMMTLEEIGRSCHAHPTLSEAIKEAALQALGQAIHL